LLRSVVVLGVLAVALVGAVSAEGAYPGRNGRIAFVRDGDIWTVWPNGTGARRLTSTPRNLPAGAGYWDSDPEWSPGGRWIAFTRHTQGKVLVPASVYVMRANGRGVRFVTAGSNPTWSPNGRWIAFEDENQILYRVRRDGSGRELIDDPREIECMKREWPADCRSWHEDPAWSPSGRYIVHSSRIDVAAELLVRDLLRYPGFVVHDEAEGDDGLAKTFLPDWSPDGRFIAFGFPPVFGCTPPCEGFDIAIVRFREWNVPWRVLKHFTQDRPGLTGIAWSPNGRRILLGVGGEIRSLGLDGSGERVVVTDAAQPDWQPLPRRPRQAS
jgi:Tol biopolymer transport system component